MHRLVQRIQPVFERKETAGPKYTLNEDGFLKQGQISVKEIPRPTAHLTSTAFLRDRRLKGKNAG
jgi:hypothetical protein